MMMRAPTQSVAWSVAAAWGRVRRAGTRLLAASSMLLGTALLSGSELAVADFGASGDGIADDGPAFARAVAALAGRPGPQTLRCANGRTYRIATGDGWALRLDRLQRVTVEGGGATLLLAGDLRGVGIHGAHDITVRGLRIDYAPLPFAEGLVVAKDGVGGTIDVDIAPGFPVPSAGGPTRAGGEQAYFAMLWDQGPFTRLGSHCMLDDLQPAPGATARTVRVRAAAGFHGYAAIVPGTTRITLPVRGIAHRRGPGAVLEIDGSSDVTIADVEIWSAPWFACTIQRNEGVVTLDRVKVRPKPGTERLTSSWRDGVHVKGNRAALRFTDCVLDGTNDDAFNIATFVSRIEAVDADTLRVRQAYPLDDVPFRVGDKLAGYAPAGGAALGPVTVRAADEQPDGPPGRAPLVILRLDRPLAGAVVGDLVWSMQAANPDTVLTRCVLRNSCRFQSRVTLDGCDAAAFLWFHGELPEGPLPSGSVIRRCHLRMGRGNPDLAAACSGTLDGTVRAPMPPSAYALNGLRFEDNDIAGRLELDRARDVHLIGNRFDPDYGRLTIRDCRDVVVEGGSVGGRPLAGSDRVQVIGERVGVQVR